MKIIIDNNIFDVKLENNSTAKAFYNMLPVTLKMNELNGNEKNEENAKKKKILRCNILSNVWKFCFNCAIMRKKARVHGKIKHF